MKKLTVILFLLFLSSCASQTQYGKCVGLDGDKDPKLIYKVSTRNALLSILTIETIITPILYIKDYIFCPIGLKPETKE